MTLTQLSLWPGLEVVIGDEPGDDGYISPTESEWQEMIRPATVPVETKRHAHGEFHTCGTKLVADKAITDDGLQAILICFQCGTYWRVGHNDERLMSLVSLVRSARVYFPQWLALRQERGEL